MALCLRAAAVGSWPQCLARRVEPTGMEPLVAMRVNRSAVGNESGIAEDHME